MPETNANLALIVADAGRDAAGRTALFHGDEVVPYAELDRLARVAAASLRGRGVEAGDRVAVTLPNGPPVVAAYLGALRLGAVLVPLNPLLAQREVDERLAVSGATVVVDDGEALLAGGEEHDEIAARGADDPAVILFTSGTSGRPKGAILTHGGIRAAATYAADALRFGPGDVVLGASPFSHVLGLSTGLFSTFLARGAVAVVPRFEAAQTLGFMTATRTTILLGVPTMCVALCEAARSEPELPPVRIAHVGGAPVLAEIARDFERTFGGEVREGYGLTEVCGLGTTTPLDVTRRPGSVGVALGDLELRVVSDDGEPLPPGEIGEVSFRGPSVIPGYWEDPEATAAALTPDGWLATGDMGTLDADGFLWIVDRKKEMVIRGGYNVYPREVEEVLVEHPAVLEAAVVGVPHDALGEEVVAVVVLRDGADGDADDIRAFAKERVAAYKYPRHVVVVDALPKGPTGKILKRQIDREALGLPS